MTKHGDGNRTDPEELPLVNSLTQRLKGKCRD